MASQPGALPFLSSKQEHRKIHFFIYILRPDETNPTQGSKAIDKDGLYRQGLVSWPKPDSQPSPIDSDSDTEWDFCELESVAAPAPAKEYLPFQSNPAILSHVQKSLLKPRCGPNGEKKGDYPLILTIDVFPGFLDKSAPTEHEKHAVKDTKDPKNHQSEAKAGDGEEAEDSPQERKLSDDERTSIDATVSRIERLIESCQVTIAKAIPNPDSKTAPEEDLVMFDIQELEQGLQKLAKNEADGVNFHWGLQNPLHGYSTEPEGVFTPYLYEKMVPRSRVEELRGLNGEWCECGC